MYKTIKVEKCQKSGKRILDKRGAQTAINSAMNLQHKEMKMYVCPDCHGYHLSTIDERNFKETRIKETINDKRRIKRELTNKKIKILKVGN